MSFERSPVGVALDQGEGGGRTVVPGWGIRVDQLGSPATRGSLTEKCRESRTVGRVRPAAKTEFVPALYASHLRDSRETDEDGGTSDGGAAGSPAGRGRGRDTR